MTEQLFDAALGELGVVARGQPCMLVGAHQNPLPAKGISAGPWVDLEASWALACGMPPAPTCKRAWNSCGGHRKDFMVGCRLAIAAVLASLFDCGRWTCRVTQPVQRTPLWPASWLPAVDKGRRSKSVEVQSVWEVYDDRLQFMSRHDAECR